MKELLKSKSGGISGVSVKKCGGVSIALFVLLDFASSNF